MHRCSLTEFNPNSNLKLEFTYPNSFSGIFYDLFKNVLWRNKPLPFRIYSHFPNPSFSNIWATNLWNSNQSILSKETTSRFSNITPSTYFFNNAIHYDKDEKNKQWLYKSSDPIYRIKLQEKLGCPLSQSSGIIQKLFEKCFIQKKNRLMNMMI